MNTKLIDAESVKLENKLEDLHKEVEQLTRAKDSLVLEVGKKTDDFNTYMAMKDSEIKKSRTQLLEEQQDFNNQKSEFQAIIKQHQETVKSFQEEKRLYEIHKLKQDSLVKNTQEFITAVRRASSLLGI